jgi:hypothetical protein
MIGFYDDEYPTGALPDWATLTEVSKALGIAREAVRSVARRALREEELWVKKKDGKLLIDTTADLYKSHVSRWQKQQEVQAFSSPEDAMDPFAAAEAKWHAHHPKHQGKTPTLYHHFPSLVLEGHRDWPELCSWLGSQGLNVFFNMLVNEQYVSLQWQWGDQQGKYYYADIKDAVIDALDCKLNAKPAVETVGPIRVPESHSATRMQWMQRFWHEVKKWRWRRR